MRMRRDWLLGCAILVLGCARTGPEIGDVSGIVTLNGEPLVHATVMFMPVPDGRSSIGTTDESGAYRLIFNLREMGALTGEHHVAISTAGADASGRNTPERVPAKYREPGALTAAVVPGKNTIHFELEP